MIAAWGDLPALGRLVAALERRGHDAAPAGDPAREADTWILGPWGDAAVPAPHARVARLLVLTWNGVHRDSPVPALRAQWAAEERARALGLPALTLRLAPLVGAASPLWRALADGARPPRRGRTLSRPVAEEDVVEAIDRALREPAPWSGWFEACGPEIWSLGELAALAREAGAGAAGAGARAGAAWEPPVEVLLAARLPEPEPWLARFGLAPEGLAARAAAWA